MYIISYLRELDNVFRLYRNKIIGSRYSGTRAIKREIYPIHRRICTLVNGNVGKPVYYLGRSQRISTDASKNNSNEDFMPSRSGTQDSITLKSPDSKLTSTELEYAVQYTQDILGDPITYVTKDETDKLLIPYPKSDMHPWLERLTRPFRESYVYEPASVMVHLCIERLENDELTTAFGIDSGFNMRAYFLTLHVWFLHRRAMKELPEGALLDRYLFSIYFNVFKEWLLVKKTPEYRFNIEFKNCQGYMMRFLIDLDKSTLDEDIYPYKIAATLKRHIYEDEVDEDKLKLLVKYTIRQFVHISNLDKKHFMDAMFLWADTKEICTPPRLLKRAMPQLVKYGGYKPLPAPTEKLEAGNKKLNK